MNNEQSILAMLVLFVLAIVFSPAKEPSGKKKEKKKPVAKKQEKHTVVTHKIYK